MLYLSFNNVNRPAFPNVPSCWINGNILKYTTPPAVTTSMAVASALLDTAAITTAASGIKTDLLVLDVELNGLGDEYQLVDSMVYYYKLLTAVRAGYSGRLTIWNTPQVSYYASQPSDAFPTGGTFNSELTNWLGAGTAGFSPRAQPPKAFRVARFNSLFRQNFIATRHVDAACLRLYTDAYTYDHGGWCRSAIDAVAAAKGAGEIVAVTTPYWTNGANKGQLIAENVRLAQYQFLNSLGVSQSVWTSSDAAWDANVLPPMRAAGWNV